MSTKEKEYTLPKEYFCLTLSRWILLLSSITLLLLGLVFFIGSIVTYSNGYKNAIVITIVNKDVTSAIICTSMTSIITAIIGIIAVFQKDRHLLACHTLLLWPCLALFITVGYLSYKDTLWDLKTILGQKWRYDFSNLERHQLQQALHCCGFENSSDHAMYISSTSCTQESLLQGCHDKLYMFQSWLLCTVYSIAFICLPLLIIMIIIALSYTRPSMPLLGRYYGGNTPIITTHHSHDSSSKPSFPHHCSACENWTF